MARDIINRSIDAGRDVSQRTQDRLEDLVSEFVRQSEEQAEQARALLTDLIGRSRTTSEQVVETVEREVRSQIANLGLATVEDIRRLEEEIDDLRGGGATRKAPARKKASSKKASAKASSRKAAAKKASSKKAAAKKASSKKAAAKKAAGR